jgi:hypothetical protein
MSSILPTQLGAVTPVDQSQLPADVRKAGPKAQQLYETAMGFEQVLLSQLTQELQSSTGGDGSSGLFGTDDGSDDSGSSDGSDATTSSMMQLLPDALAQGMEGSGGIGIARELYDSMAARAGISTGTGGGT